jgi:hypothetical protein
MRFILMAVSLALFASSPASAGCLEKLSGLKDLHDATCEPLTDRLLVGLEDATRADVSKAIKVIGRQTIGPNVHIYGSADTYSGGVDLTFEGDRVVLIFAGVDDPENFKTMWFKWNPAYHGPSPNPCSDLPGSRYARCGK